MVLTRDFDSIKTQQFTIRTDVQNGFGVVCAVTATLVSPPIFVTLQDDIISVDESLTTVADVGPITISVLVDSLDFPAQVADVTYSFVLDVQHCVVNSFILPQISDLSYVIRQGDLAVNLQPATWTNLACIYTSTYSITSVSGAASSVPTWLVLD
jgi:hypothetical protein